MSQLIEIKRVLLVDDHGLVRKGLKSLLMMTEPTLAVHECATYEEAITKLTHESYDIALVDIELGSAKSGLDLLQWIRESDINVQVVILSGKDDRQTINNCLSEGASGFIPKATNDENVFRKAFQIILSGSLFLPNNAYGRGGYVPPQLNIQDVENLDTMKLSPRLTETLYYLCQGMPNKKIAQSMGGIADTVVRDYCSELYRRFKVTGRVPLIIEVARRGYVIPKPKPTHA